MASNDNDKGASLSSAFLKYIPIISFCLSIGAIGMTTLRKESSLEYLTKQDFSAYQLDATRKITQLDSSISSGFDRVSQQIATLNFVPTKDFQDFKEKARDADYGHEKSLELLKRDIESIQRELSNARQKSTELEVKLAVLQDSLRRIQDEARK